jgi:tape measure domain-containing protein
MSGNLDDLEFKLNVELDDSLRGLREVAGSLDSVRNELTVISPEMERSVVASSDLSDYWQYLNRDVQNSSESIRRFAEQARQAATATQTIVVETVATPQRPQPSQGMDLVKLASAALAVKAVSGVATAMTKAKTAIASIDTTTKTAVLSLDRFRMGLAAPAVNPALNTLPGVIQNIAGKVAGAVESFRGFGDATIQGAPSIMTAISNGMATVLGSGDRLQATVSKITSQFDLHRGALDRVAKIYPTTGTAVGMLKDAMDFIAPAAEKVAQKVDAANEKVRDAAISARNLAFVATGAFAKTGTSADLYAKGAYHALLPTRLMAFEAKFAAGSMGLVRNAFNVVTAPIHSVQMALQRSSGEFRELRANLPPLSGNLNIAINAIKRYGIANIGVGNSIKMVVSNLQIGVRSLRAFSHATLAASQTLSAVKTAARPITFVASSLWSLVRPAKAAKVGLDGVATGGHQAGIVLRGVQAAASKTAGALNQVGAAGAKMASGSATSFLSALPGRAMMGATALGAMAIAAGGFGAQFAMATEKNEAVFGVMLKDMEQGKAVVDSLQDSKAVGLFDNDEVLNSGRLLYKAGVAAVDLQGKTEQLATIAAATSTELADLTRIYQQGANRGSYGQDKINQMAERGIDIYHALEATTGKSGAALTDMISSGKIGVAEMDAALAHLTEGNGIYAGSLETLAGTSSGMLSQIKNNLLQALGGLSGVGLEAFKPILAGVLSLSEGIKTSIGAVAPLVTQAFMVIKAAFTGIWQVVTSTFTGIFGAGAATFGGLLSATMEWVTMFRWAFENMVPVFQFVGLSMTGIFVTAFNDVAYWLTDTMPSYLTWFGENWTNVFTDIATGTATIFTNLASNIGNAMTAIWEFIKSGGTADLELAWTPLLTGFESTVAALPDIPERAMTELEQAIQTQTEQIGTQLADSYDQMHAEAQAALTLEPPTMPEIDPNLQSGGMKDGQGEAGGNSRKSFAVSGLEKGSEAALQAVFAAQKDNTPGQHLAEAKKQTKLLGKMAASKPSGRIAGKV